MLGNLRDWFSRRGGLLWKWANFCFVVELSDFEHSFFSLASKLGKTGWYSVGHDAAPHEMTQLTFSTRLPPKIYKRPLVNGITGDGFFANVTTDTTPVHLQFDLFWWIEYREI